MRHGLGLGLRLALLANFALFALQANTAAARSHRVRPVHALHHQVFFSQTGRASYYGRKHDGKLTAEGGRFDRREFTAAHRTLPFGTVVRVTNLANGRMIKARIADRGPHVRGRIIDLSAAAARELGMQRRGLARVRVKALRSDQESRIGSMVAAHEPEKPAVP